MISEETLINIINNWSPETDSVNILKTIFDDFGISIYELSTNDEYSEIWEAVCYISWAEKYIENSYNTPFVESGNIMTVDSEGDCLCYDFEIRKFEDIRSEFENWLKEQEQK